MSTKMKGMPSLSTPMITNDYSCKRRSEVESSICDKDFSIRCYKRNGNLDHEEYFDTLEEAVKRRTEWGLSIGLKPEPSTDFARYPTIWKDGERIEGY